MILYSSMFFFKQKTAYEMRISDWSSDVCSSDLQCRKGGDARVVGAPGDLLAAKQAIEKRFGRRQRARDRTDDQALERGAVEHSKRGRQQGRRREREQQPGARIGDLMRQFLRSLERRELVYRCAQLEEARTRRG